SGPEAEARAGEVAEGIAPQPLPPVRLQRLPVLRDSAAQLLQDVRVALHREAGDHRGSRTDPVLSLDLGAHLQEGALTRAPARLGYIPVAAADGRLRLQYVEQPAHFVDVDPGIPDVEETHRGVPRLLGAVAAHGQPHAAMGIAG